MKLQLWEFLFAALLSAVIGVEPPDCGRPLEFTDDQIRSKSTDPLYPDFQARLNQNIGTGAWCGLPNSRDAVIGVDFNRSMLIKAIAIQGHFRTNSVAYVSKFKIYYQRSSHLVPIARTFSADKDGTKITYVGLTIPPTTTVIIQPVEWFPKTAPCLRFEIYGCDDVATVATTSPPSTPTTPTDPCRLRNGGCEHLCASVNGSAVCKCHPGYERLDDGRSCVDIDECYLGTDKCDNMSTFCVNINGSYGCKCRFDGLKLVPPYHHCEDVNECLDGHNGFCQQVCINTYRTHKCDCYEGYRLNADNRTCSDIDECAEGTFKCVQHATCTNTRGSYRCYCLPGLRLGIGWNSTYQCKDIDECQEGTSGCSNLCENTFGSYRCKCVSGAILTSDNHTCEDINECLTTKHGCQQLCLNYYGSYSCDCFKGYQLLEDKKTCTDVNECELNPGPCQYMCNNTVGSYKCYCPDGFQLASNEQSCIDIDECSTQVHNCNEVTSECANSYGSFECRCKPEFTKNPTTGACEYRRCPALTAIADGFMAPSDCLQPDAKQVKDVCEFKCNEGFELNEQSAKKAYCDRAGQWVLDGGSSPLCTRVKCPIVEAVDGGTLIPIWCGTQGSIFGQTCRVYCLSGYDLVGNPTVTCRKDGTYDRSFNSSVICAKKPEITCPADLKMDLPIGASAMPLPKGKINITIPSSAVTTQPDGALEGTYKFGLGRTIVTVTATNAFGYSASCSFQVTVIDKEPPVVLDCPEKDVYVTIPAEEGVVSWKEPRFEDNVKVTKVIQNLRNGIVLSQQVYFVFYAARDESGNQAMCRFFVHVRAKYCSADRIPGGDGATKAPFSMGSGMNVVLQCPTNKTFSHNTTGFVMFRCSAGEWGNVAVPDCVDFVKKNGDCPPGTTVTAQGRSAPVCSACPKGTSSVKGKCVPCFFGTYQDVAGSTECKPCPEETTTKEEGAKSISNCQDLCGPGEFSSTGLTGSSCQPCPKGSFQALSGQRSCHLCEGGGDSDAKETKEQACKLGARITQIVPSSQIVTAVVNDNITIECYATGSPFPHVKIVPVDDRANNRTTTYGLQTSSKYVTGVGLKISNVELADTALYRCIADNRNGSEGNLDEREILVEVIEN